jgi:hypothetical protein
MSVHFTVRVSGSNKYIKITDLLNTDKETRVKEVAVNAGAPPQAFEVNRSVDSPRFGYVWFDVAKDNGHGHVPDPSEYKRVDKYSYPEDTHVYNIDDNFL